jgi:NifU-like protein involved in Fe-S cluster formation
MQVVDHYDNPRNVGSFDKSDPNVGTGLVGAPACGDVMKLQIKVGVLPIELPQHFLSHVGHLMHHSQ